MGPVSRYLGPWVPEPQLWQDPVPAVDHELIDEADVAALKETDPRLGPVDLAARRDRVGGGGVVPRHRQARRRQRRADPPRAAEGLGGQRAGRARRARSQTLEQIQQDFNDSQSGGKQVSLADLIVLGGCAAVEQAAKNAGHDVTVPFAPGRTDASQEQTDVESFAVLEPTVDGFRNYLARGRGAPARARAARAGLHADADRSGDDGPDRRHARAERELRRSRSTASSPTGPETLTNDFFVNLLDMGTEWKPSARRERLRGARPQRRGEVKWTATAGRPRVRLELAAAGARGGLRVPTTRARSSCATSSPPGTRS